MARNVSRTNKISQKERKCCVHSTASTIARWKHFLSAFRSSGERLACTDPSLALRLPPNLILQPCCSLDSLLPAAIILRREGGQGHSALSSCFALLLDASPHGVKVGDCRHDLSCSRPSKSNWRCLNLFNSVPRHPLVRVNPQGTFP